MTMPKSLAQMAEEIRVNNTEKGWRPAEGGPGDNTFGDYVALLHSELSEALEAYRDHRLADATAETLPALPGGIPAVPAKPEGVGSEFADVLIRLIDMCDIFALSVFDMGMEVADVAPLEPDVRDGLGEVETFGDWIAWLHWRVTELHRRSDHAAPHMLRALVAASDRFGIDLTYEYERKIAYNRTRAYQHGGRTLSDTSRTAA
jgi:hypothetical protein